MKNRNAGVIILAILSFVSNAQERSLPDTAMPDHPRILLLKGQENEITAALIRSPAWSKMHNAILRASDIIIDQPPLERIQIGRRLLDKSREALRRIFYLSYSWRMTRDEKYFARAEKELLTISKFSDWNPSHFLDVAEMTMAAAIGYDWLFEKLSLDSRRQIREAILKKGIEPSQDSKYNSFLSATHNWNQVCNAGISYGALAIWEDEPQTAKAILERALNTIHLPMGDYKPDGAYPEGYGYWGYGTSFNVMFLSAVERIFATDFGLSQSPGFLTTGRFMENMTGATGLCFNWGDASLGASLKPAMFWFADKNNDPSLLWVEKSYLQRDDFSKFTNDRLLPAIMIWGKNLDLDKIVVPASLVYVGQGLNPVALMRTSWTDPNGVYLGFKVGSPGVNHGHMDIGSFIMESDGIRWAADFGMQDYESLESKGIQVFGRSQDAQRWTIFRLNNFVHNTLTVDHQLQLVKGYARIDRWSDRREFPFAISDLTSVYESQLARVRRGVGIVNEEVVVVRDELEATDRKTTTVRWTMLTPADVAITGENTATLTKDDKTLFLSVYSREKIEMKIWTTQPTTGYDAPNPGTSLVGFEVQLPAHAKQAITVFLIPGSVKKKVPRKMRSLENWH